MLRIIGLLTVVTLLLAACGGAQTPADEPATASRANCETAFQQIDAEAETMQRLEMNVQALDSTVEQCPTVEDWIEVATDQLPDVDLSNAESFLAARCAENPQLADSVLCQDL